MTLGRTARARAFRLPLRDTASAATTRVASAWRRPVATAALGAAQGFFVPYLTGGISIAVLAVGSTAPGLLEFAIGKFSSLFPVRAPAPTRAARCSLRQVPSQSGRASRSPAGALSLRQVHSQCGRCTLSPAGAQRRLHRLAALDGMRVCETRPRMRAGLPRARAEARGRALPVRPPRRFRPACLGGWAV